MLIQLLGAFVVVYHVLRAVWSSAHGQGSDLARLLIADGVLAALGFMVAGTLLNAIALQTLRQIRTFAVVFTLRTLLKRVFAAERRSISLH